MKVRIHNRMAGPDGNFAAGSTLDLEPAAAKKLIDAGAATLIEKPKVSEKKKPPAKSDTKTERATAEPVAEKAVNEPIPAPKTKSSKKGDDNK